VRIGDSEGEGGDGEEGVYRHVWADKLRWIEGEVMLAVVITVVMMAVEFWLF